VLILSFIFSFSILFTLLQIWVFGFGIKKYGFNKSQCIVMALSFLTPIILVSISELTTPNIEWNPLIRNDTEIVGSWIDDKELLTINEDHTFKLIVGDSEYSGGWSLDDWNFTFDYYSTGMPYDYLRVIHHSNKYHLVKGTLDRGPDAWNYNNAFIRQ
jgi:hypothetical protein